MSNQLSAEDLVASGAATYTVKVPAALLKANGEAETAGTFAGEVMLRPLGGVVVITPPLTIAPAEVDLLLEGVHAAIKEATE